MESDDLRNYLESFTRSDWQESPTDAGPVRFALIGLGWWTVDEAMPAIEDSTFCETTAVVSGSSGKAESVADEHESVEAGLTYEVSRRRRERYLRRRLRLYAQRSPPRVRRDGDVPGRRSSVKPMEATLERAEAVADACEDADAPAMIAYRMHTEPAVRRARELVRSGAIGDPVSVHGTMSQSIVDWGPDQWRLDSDLVGYGASVSDLGIYPINTSRFVLDRDPVAVQSTMDSTHEYFEDVPDEVAAFTVSYEGGIYAACTASQHSQLESFLRIVGTEGRSRSSPPFTWRAASASVSGRRRSTSRPRRSTRWKRSSTTLPIASSPGESRTRIHNTVSSICERSRRSTTQPNGAGRFPSMLTAEIPSSVSTPDWFPIGI